MHAQLGRVLIELNEPDSAVFHAKTSHLLSRKIESESIEELALDAMCSALYANGETEKANMYVDTLTQYVIELNELERHALVTELETKYEIDLRKAEIKNLEGQKAQSDRLNSRQKNGDHFVYNRPLSIDVYGVHHDQRKKSI